MPIQMTCDCGKTLRVKDESAGKKVRCPGCQAILTAPNAEPILVDQDENEEFSHDEQTAVTTDSPRPSSRSRRSDADDEDVPTRRRRRDVDDDDEVDEEPRRRKKKRHDDDDDDIDMEDRRLRPPPDTSNMSPQAGIGLGIFLMVGSTIWCIAGLAFDYFFFYPPILFIIGIVVVITAAVRWTQQK